MLYFAVSLPASRQALSVNDGLLLFHLAVIANIARFVSIRLFA